MANYVPTLVGSVGGPPQVDVSMANGYSYSQFINSMTSLFYFLYELSIDANVIPQVQQVYSFNYKDAYGDIHSDEIPFVLDPFQIQINLDIYFKKNQYILNGQTALSFTLLANQSINLYLYVIQFNPSDLLQNIKSAKRGFDFINQIQNYLANFKESFQPEIDKIETSD